MKLILILPIILIATPVLLRAEVDTGRPCGGTPYDAYMGPMRQTYARLGDGSPSINDVRSQLRTAYRFRYYFDAAQPYTPQLPEVTESRQQGDCKAKSLWLLSKMDTRDARYVLGKATTGSRISHVVAALVEWRHVDHPRSNQYGGDHRGRSRRGPKVYPEILLQRPQRLQTSNLQSIHQ